MSVRALLVKTSSMGDLIHALPAISDAAAAVDARFDWIVEENFKEIPAWHPAVDRVLPVAVRRWRRNLFSPLTHRQWREFQVNLRRRNYDYVIDSQGLYKSVFLACMAKGPRYGMDFDSAREKLAACLYHYKLPVPVEQHAIHRQRQLMASALGYALPDMKADYGLGAARFHSAPNIRDSLVFIHDSAERRKLWPLQHWRELVERAGEADIEVYLPQAGETAKNRAERIAEGYPHCHVLPHLNLNALGGILGQSRAVVAVDTGLAHLAAALERPSVVIYGPSDPARCGSIGVAEQVHLRNGTDPAAIAPQQVWEALPIEGS